MGLRNQQECPYDVSKFDNITIESGPGTDPFIIEMDYDGVPMSHEEIQDLDMWYPLAQDLMLSTID